MRITEWLRQLSSFRKKQIIIAIVFILLVVVALSFNWGPKGDQKLQTLLDKGDYKSILAIYEPKVSKGGNNYADMKIVATAHIQKAIAEHNQLSRSTSISIALLKNVTRQDPTDHESFRLLGHAYALRKEFTEAEESFNKALLVSNGKNDEAIAGLGLVKESVGEFKEASYAYIKTLNLNPKNDIASLGLARWEIRNKNITAIESRLERPLVSTNASIRAEAYTLLGSFYLLDKKNTEAIGAFEKSISIGSKDPQVRLLLAQAYVNQYFLDVKLSKRAEMIKKSLALIEEAISLQPNNITAHKQLYKIYLMQKDTEKLNQIGKKILELSEADPTLSAEEKKKNKSTYSVIPIINVKSLKFNTEQK